MSTPPRAFPRRLRWILSRVPHRTNIHRYPGLRWIAPLTRKAPWCWSYQRGPLVAAIWLGSIMTVLPVIGIQLPLAMVLAIVFRANLTVTGILQFASNPFTFAPIFAATYTSGMAVLEAVGATGTAVGWGDRINALFVGGVIVGSALALVLHVGLAIALRRRKATRLPRAVPEPA